MATVCIRRRKDFWAVLRNNKVVSRHHLKTNARDMANKLRRYGR